jgi:hypothetical protein
MTSNPPLTRRQLLGRGAGLAAGLGLAAVAGPVTSASAASRAVVAPSAPAAPSSVAPVNGPVVWDVVGNGVPGQFRFWKRLKHEHSYDVSGGFVADAYGDAALAYTAGFGGINVARLCDRDLNYFQIWRTTGHTGADPYGTFYDYTRNGSRYVVGGPYPWRTTLRHGDADPWGLVIDNEEKTSFGIEARSAYGTFPGWMRELHHYNGPANERQLWGSVYDESFAGYTAISPPFYSQSSTPTEMWVNYSSRYTFLRALDRAFGAFQVYRGTYWRSEYYRLDEVTGGWQFYGAGISRSGIALHIDTASGAQEDITWKST